MEKNTEETYINRTNIQHLINRIIYKGRSKHICYSTGFKKARKKENRGLLKNATCVVLSPRICVGYKSLFSHILI